MKKEWKLNQREEIYDGFYKLSRMHFQHTLFKGGWSESIDRELLERGNVAALLPYDPATDTVVLVEQFRVGSAANGNPWLTEVIAGMVEPGESPDEMVRREAREEAGLEVAELLPVCQYYSSPGSSTEQVFIYASLLDLSQAGGLYGLEEEGEDIRVVKVSAPEAIELLDSGVICNALSVIAMQWFKLNHASLSARAL